MAKATHLNRPYEAVTVVLSNYFDALYESDAAKLSRVFHPLAHYVCVSDGTLQYLRMNEYLPIVENRPSPASRGELRHDRILSIEFAGPVTAVARVECGIGVKFFNDVLTLIFMDQQWCIISKVFHFDIREERPTLLQANN
jgi:hypothetical protein